MTEENVEVDDQPRSNKAIANVAMRQLQQDFIMTKINTLLVKVFPLLDTRSLGVDIVHESFMWRHNLQHCIAVEIAWIAQLAVHHITIGYYGPDGIRYLITGFDADQMFSYTKMETFSLIDFSIIADICDSIDDLRQALPPTSKETST